MTCEGVLQNRCLAPVLQIFSSNEKSMICEGVLQHRCLAPVLQIFVVVALGWAPGVFAAPTWAVREGGMLGFTATWEGTPFHGVFHRFVARIAFDPADLEGSRFDVEVDVTSADTRSSDRDEGLSDPEWFDYARHPKATFVSQSYRALGDDRYEATGTLTIKGIAREITFPFSWEPHGDGVRLRGETKLVRTDFDVGVGEWSAGDVVGLEVDVHVDLELVPDGAAD
jgi:polyisoprenoid-binding protein YceI